MAACRRSRSLGTLVLKIKAGGAGSISIQTRTFDTTTFSTGPSSTRIGTSCVPSATRQGYARTTMRQTTATQQPGPRSALVARPVTDRAPTTLPGHAHSEAGGHSNAAMTQAKDCSRVSMSVEESFGGTILAPERCNATFHRMLCARRSKCAAGATRAAARFLRIGYLDGGYWIHMLSHRR